jgi:glycosyltransferase involved in cell wall biosynthesis
VNGVARIPRLKVALLSDVSLGYGTPQLLRMAESFAQAFGAEVHIFEPDEPERPLVDIRNHVKSPRVSLERIYTTAHPYWKQGRIEYCAQVAAKVASLDPQIILFSAMYGIQVLDRIDARNTLKIFYCIEEVDTYYDYLFPLVRQCEIMLFPEENRARIYLERLGGPQAGQDHLIIYNTNDRREWTPPDERLPRLFYGGTFDKVGSLAEYFLRPETLDLPVDIYGVLRGFDDPAEVAAQLSGHSGGAAFRGYRQSDDGFFKLLSRYLYSIIIWNPDREDRLYAAPNKLFDALACGVPPIAAPHPQCAEVIRRWNCGVLMDDWSFESFKDTLGRALKTAGSDYYRELAANCRRAMDEELCWERQFDKLIPAVERRLARLGDQPATARRARS